MKYSGEILGEKKKYHEISVKLLCAQADIGNLPNRLHEHYRLTLLPHRTLQSVSESLHYERDSTTLVVDAACGGGAPNIRNWFRHMACI